MCILIYLTSVSPNIFWEERQLGDAAFGELDAALKQRQIVFGILGYYHYYCPRFEIINQNMKYRIVLT